MPEIYEYKFVRLETTGFQLLGTHPAKSAKEGYQQEVHTHAREGWRLVQIFAPGTGIEGHASYFELIFERPLSDSSEEE